MSALARRCLLVLAIALPTSALAAKSAHENVTFDAAAFAEQKEALVKALRSERYAEITPEDKEKVVDALDRMQTQLASVTAIDQLEPKARTAVYNDQELINQILTQAAEDSRIVCSREQVTGSHRQTNVCKTVAQRRHEREAAQNSLRNEQRAGLRPPAGG